MKFLTAAQLRQAEEQAGLLGMRTDRLMENAGSAAARVIRRRYGEQGRRAVVLCGRGNNGGDGYVAARRLRESDWTVTAVAAEGPPAVEPAAQMYRQAVQMGIPILDYRADPAKVQALLQETDAVVDALFGTGFHGTPQGAAASLIDMANASPAPKIALDLPSGAVCDTGAVGGACVRAAVTVSFHSYKFCHILQPAAASCGTVVPVEIGMPPQVLDSLQTPVCSVDPDLCAGALRPRDPFSHKGDFGKALLVCGSYGMAGAASIAARAAVRSGAGLVRVALPQSVYPIAAARLDEAVWLPMPETADGVLSLAGWPGLRDALDGCDAVLLGCGLGRGHDVTLLCEKTLAHAKIPVVLDADGINALAARISMIEHRAAPLILTPHPGEMARLLGCAAADVQRDRLGAACGLAKRYGVCVVLKGAQTVVAHENGTAQVLMCGNPGMATAGSGDMLAGMLVSFLAQGIAVETAAAAAAYFHAVAGDETAARVGQRAMTPSDMIEALSGVFYRTEGR